MSLRTAAIQVALFAATFVLGVVVGAPCDFAATTASTRPIIAVFPIGGDANLADRQRCGFSLRAKLARDGIYEPIDGPTMDELSADAQSPITFETTVEVLKSLSADEKPAILIWGDLAKSPGKIGHLRLKTFDLRNNSGKPEIAEVDINQPTDLRFAVESVLSKLPGLALFEHASEEAVHHDAQSDAAWARNPNLIVNGDFSSEGHWEGLFKSEDYPLKFSSVMADTDKIVIWQSVENGKKKNLLSMTLSKDTAENNGLAALSDAIKILPHVRYRLQFKYRTAGPAIQPFVKGYTNGKDLAGKPALREVYRRQVQATTPVKGNWTTVECDVNPLHPSLPVEFLKVDLFAYASPGQIQFDDVQLRAVGQQRPTTQP